MPHTDLAPALPDDLPERLRGPAAWYGPDMAARSDWIVPLAGDALDEIKQASQRWLKAQPDALQAELSAPAFSSALRGLTRAQFPLPGLAGWLVDVLNELQNGRGFVLLRGLPVAQWGPQLSAVAFYGLVQHLGAARPQNAQGRVLGHVRDVGLASSDPNVLHLPDARAADLPHRFV